jgi:hypothetical protein
MPWVASLSSTSSFTEYYDYFFACIPMLVGERACNLFISPCFDVKDTGKYSLHLQNGAWKRYLVL